MALDVCVPSHSILWVCVGAGEELTTSTSRHIISQTTTSFESKHGITCDDECLQKTQLVYKIVLHCCLVSVPKAY